MKKRTVLVTISFALLLLGLLPSASLANGPGTQMVLLIDGSYSISGPNFSIMKQGIAAAVADPNCLPQNGSVELSVVQFSSSAAVNVAPTVINSQTTATNFAAAVAAITQQAAFATNYQAAFNLASTTITGSPNFDPTGFQAINMSTDGEPNQPSGNARAAAVTARDAAISAAGVDEIDVEAINMQLEPTTWIQNNIVYPQPGHIVADDGYIPGWVIEIPSFEVYASSLCQKFQEVVPPEINVEKSSTTTAITTAGQVVPYTFVVTNGGDTALSGITVSDPNCTSAILGPTGDTNTDSKLDPDETWTYTCNHTVTQAEIDAGGNLSNTVTAESNESAPDTDSHDIPITQNVMLSVEKTGTFDAGADGYADPGELISYQFRVTNTSNVTLHYVLVTDPKVATITCPSGNPIPSLAVGASETCTGSYAVTQADIDAGSVHNVGTADSRESGPASDASDLILRTPAPHEPEFVPEPGSMLLLGSGLMGLAGYATLRRRARH